MSGPWLSRQVSTVPEFLGFIGVYYVCGFYLSFLDFHESSQCVDVLIHGYQDPPPVSISPPLVNDAFISPLLPIVAPQQPCCSHRKEVKGKENSGYNCIMACGAPVQDLLLTPKWSDKSESPSARQTCLEELLRQQTRKMARMHAHPLSCRQV